MQRETRGCGRSGVGVALVMVLALCGCASTPKDSYWTRKGGTDKQFRKISLACNERASDDILKEGSGENCGYNTAGRGTYCTRVDPNNPYAVEQEKRRVERRLTYLYSQCLESAGWTKNYEGRGYKGRH